jgi:hypothetical protein
VGAVETHHVLPLVQNLRALGLLHEFEYASFLCVPPDFRFRSGP